MNQWVNQLFASDPEDSSSDNDGDTPLTPPSTSPPRDRRALELGESTSTAAVAMTPPPARSAEREAAFEIAKGKHRSAAHALTTALKAAHEIVDKSGATKNDIAPLVSRALARADDYDTAISHVLEFSRTDDLEEDPSISPYLPRQKEYIDKVDAFKVKAAKWLPKHAGATGGSKFAKLPEIKRELFDGEHREKFSVWWDTHMQLIDGNDDLEEAQKLSYLYQGTKEGSKARQCIEGLPLEANQYENMKALLLAAYASKRSLHDLILRLVQTEKCTSYEAPAQRALLNTLLKLHRGIVHHKNLNKSSDYDCLFLPIVLQKLPNGFTKRWAETKNKLDETEYSALTVTTLLDDFRNAVEALELTTVPKSKPPQDGAKGRQNGPQDSGTKSSKKAKAQEKKLEVLKTNLATLGVKTSEPQAKGAKPKTPPKCILCDGAHVAKSCKVPMSPAQRREKLEGSNSCINCLGTHHLAEACRTAHGCTKCQVEPKHHTLCHTA